MKHRLLTSAAAIAVINAAAVTVIPATAGASPARPAVTATGPPSFVVVSQASSLKVFNTSTGAAAGTLKAPAGLQLEGVASGGTSQRFPGPATQAPATTATRTHPLAPRTPTAQRTGFPSAGLLPRGPGREGIYLMRRSPCRCQPHSGLPVVPALHCLLASISATSARPVSGSALGHPQCPEPADAG